MCSSPPPCGIGAETWGSKAIYTKATYKIYKIYKAKDKIQVQRA
jgi:hypothetical protein